MYGNKLGELAWMDLTVPNAEQVKDFYHKVLGWQSDAVGMSCEEGAYEDYTMIVKTAEASEKSSPDEPSASQFVTGVCHAKGGNADMPAVWLPYFLIADIEAAATVIKAEGGDLVTQIKSMGDDKYMVIKDPAGAQCVLYQKGN